VTGELTATERESVTAYLRRLAHDLRSPPRAVLSYSALLREGALGRVNDAQHAALDDMVASARELAAIVGAVRPEGRSMDKPAVDDFRPIRRDRQFTQPVYGQPLAGW
jgi:signal transduction histidine kinase